MGLARQLDILSQASNLISYRDVTESRLVMYWFSSFEKICMISSLKYYSDKL